VSDVLTYIEQKYNDEILVASSFELLEEAKEDLVRLYNTKTFKEESKSANIEIHIAKLEVNDGGTAQIADLINNTDYPIIQTALRSRIKAVHSEINKKLQAEIRDLLPHFNFEEQKKSFEDYWEEIENCATFLIHGKRNSGQDILLDFFLKDNRISITGANNIKSKASNVLNQTTFRHLIETLYAENTKRKDFSHQKTESLISVIFEQLLAKLQMGNVIIQLSDWLRYFRNQTGELQSFFASFWKPLHEKLKVHETKYKLIICFIENQPIVDTIDYFSSSAGDCLNNNQFLMLPHIQEICETHVHQWINGHIKTSKYKIYFKHLYRELFSNEVKAKAIIEEEGMVNHKEFHDYIYEMFKYKCLLTFQH
jgi:hypothetical protein